MYYLLYKTRNKQVCLSVCNLKDQGSANVAKKRLTDLRLKIKITIQQKTQRRLSSLRSQAGHC